VKLSKAAIHNLSAAGRLVLTVRVTVTGASGTKLTRSGTVTLQR
jgi:hypothetical protein